MTGPVGSFVSGLDELVPLATAAGVEPRPGIAGGEGELAPEELAGGVGEMAVVATFGEEGAEDEVGLDDAGVLEAGAVDAGGVG